MKFYYRVMLLLVTVLILTCIPGFGDEVEEGFGDLHLKEQWSGDLDGMVERKVIRVLVAHNKMLYFLDRGRQRGVNVDLFEAFEKFINTKEKTGTVKVRILFLAV